MGSSQMEAKTIKKYDKYTVSQLIKKAQVTFNKFIRLRDAKDGFFICISCRIPKPLNQMNAGHYLSTGHNTAVRFNEDNCHSQCIRCNRHLHGNQSNYRIGLVNKIGLQRVEALEKSANKTIKYDRFTLIDLIETYKQKVNGVHERKNT